MLTFALGHAGRPSEGLAMARHLSEPTLTPELAANAARFDLLGVDLSARTAPTVSCRDPGLRALLGLPDHDALSLHQIANLLSGHRADGAPIPGATRRQPRRSLAAALGIGERRMPAPSELDLILSGRLANGEPMKPGDAHLQARLLALHGVPSSREATPSELTRITAGLRCDGSPLNQRKCIDSLHRQSRAVAYLDATFAADKSVSVAWACCASGAEQAAIAGAFGRAVADSLEGLREVIGRTRRGDGGQYAVPGQVACLSFLHFTARPTGVDRRGQLVASGRGAGTPHLHQQNVFLNAVLADDGRIGALDLNQLKDRVHELGALFQAYLLTHLRELGFDAVFDPSTQSARMTAVPDDVRAAFSSRTIEGRERTRTYLEKRGLTWDDLPRARRIALLKRGVQGDPRLARTDDVSDLAAWHAIAEAHGFRRRSFADLDKAAPIAAAAERIPAAAAAAQAFLDGATQRGDAMTPRLAAARGLIVTGIGALSEIDSIAATLRPPPGVPAVRTMTGTERGAGLLRAKRAEGSAVLVEGGEQAVVARAASLWWEARLQNPPCPPGGILVETEAQATTVSAAIRDRCRREGVLGPDRITVKVARASTIGLGTGDVLMLTRPVNAAGSDGRAGRIGTAGSLLRIQGLNDETVILQTAEGRSGTVRWESLYDTASGHFAFRHGYAGTDISRATAVAFFGEARSSVALARSPGAVLLFDAGAVRASLTASLGRSPAPEDLWRALETKMGGTSQRLEALVASTRRVARAASALRGLCLMRLEAAATAKRQIQARLSAAARQTAVALEAILQVLATQTAVTIRAEVSQSPTSHETPSAGWSQTHQRPADVRVLVAQPVPERNETRVPAQTAHQAVAGHPETRLAARLHTGSRAQRGARARAPIEAAASPAQMSLAGRSVALAERGRALVQTATLSLHALGQQWRRTVSRTNASASAARLAARLSEWDRALEGPATSAATATPPTPSAAGRDADGATARTDVASRMAGIIATFDAIAIRRLAGRLKRRARQTAFALTRIPVKSIGLSDHHTLELPEKRAVSYRLGDSTQAISARATENIAVINVDTAAPRDADTGSAVSPAGPLPGTTGPEQTRPRARKAAIRPRKRDGLGR